MKRWQIKHETGISVRVCLASSVISSESYNARIIKNFDSHHHYFPKVQIEDSHVSKVIFMVLVMDW